MRSLIPAAALLLALSPAAMAGAIYKWVDAQGVTHFDAQPPAGQRATPVEGARPVTPPGEAKPGATEQEKDAIEQRKIDKQVKFQVADQEAKRGEFCTTARTNLAQLQNNPRVRQEVDGELRRLTETERQAKIEEVQGMLNEQCR